MNEIVKEEEVMVPLIKERSDINTVKEVKYKRTVLFNLGIHINVLATTK